MKHLTACRMLARLPSPVSIRFDMRGVSVWYTVRPGSGTKGRSTYGKQGFQLEGELPVQAPDGQAACPAAEHMWRWLHGCNLAQLTRRAGTAGSACCVLAYLLRCWAALHGCDLHAGWLPLPQLLFQPAQRLGLVPHHPAPRPAGQSYVDATTMQRLPAEVLDILKEPIEGLRRAPQNSAAGSEPQAASVYSPGEVSPPNQDPEASTHNEGLRMIRGPVALRAVGATPHTCCLCGLKTS